MGYELSPLGSRSVPPPPLSRAQSRRVDTIAIQRYGLSGLVLMENAGRGVVDVLVELGIDGPVVVLCGKGNNAGDGLVIARHLDLRGYRVRVLLWSDPAALRGDAAANYAVAAALGLSIERPDPRAVDAQLDGRLAGNDWLVDALLGTGVEGEPRPPLDRVIDRFNAAAGRKLAVDLPSGLDCDRGQPARHTIVAHHTCTMFSPKIGFAAPGAAAYTGRVHVVDIGIPPRVADELSA
jgi:NAD(P)H-hydrate epimerase